MRIITISQSTFQRKLCICIASLVLTVRLAVTRDIGLLHLRSRPVNLVTSHSLERLSVKKGTLLKNSQKNFVPIYQTQDPELLHLSCISPLGSNKEASCAQDLRVNAEKNLASEASGEKSRHWDKCSLGARSICQN